MLMMTMTTKHSPNSNKEMPFALRVYNQFNAEFDVRAFFTVLINSVYAGIRFSSIPSSLIWEKKGTLAQMIKSNEPGREKNKEKKQNLPLTACPNSSVSSVNCSRILSSSLITHWPSWFEPWPPLPDPSCFLDLLRRIKLSSVRLIDVNTSLVITRYLLKSKWTSKSWVNTGCTTFQ